MLNDHFKKIFKILCIYIFCLFLFCEVAKADIYYVRLDITFVDDIVINSNISMLPASEEFRFERMQSINVISISNQNTLLDMETSAKHDAVHRILLTYGLKSIKCKKKLLNGRLSDISTLSYEGVVRHPFKIIKKNYSKTHNQMEIEANISFSPIALPKKWSRLYLKKQLSKSFHDFLNFFKE